MEGGLKFKKNPPWTLIKPHLGVFYHQLDGICQNHKKQLLEGYLIGRVSLLGLMAKALGLRGGCIEAPDRLSIEAQRAESGARGGVLLGRGSQPIPRT